MFASAPPAEQLEPAVESPSWPAVLTQLGALEAALRSVCAQLDPRVVPVGDAPAGWERFDAIARLAEGAKVRLAGRVAESNRWRHDGFPSAAAWMARTAGTTDRAAKEAIATAERLRDLPHVDDAVATGALSVPKAVAVADGAAADPTAEQHLVRQARDQGVRQLQETARRVKHAVDRDADARHARIHRNRSLRTWVDPDDGSFQLRLTTTVDAGAEIRAILRPWSDQAFHRARAAGQPASPDAMAHDGFVAALRAAHASTGGSTPAGSPAPAPDAAPAPAPGADAPKAASKRPESKVIFVVDLPAFERGALRPGERCEIAGIGPVPLSVLRRHLPGAFLAAVVKHGADVNVAHLGRSATAHQRTALEEHGYRCAAPGCDTTWALDIDHHHPWSRGGQTKLANLQWLCTPHHTDKTRREQDATDPRRRRQDAAR
ncbi:MAG: DUF222 domain-containing protein [Actinobacteria bacterium]|nr:DUF222 domain-containing protein [Actinomycetota bacterium]